MAGDIERTGIDALRGLYLEAARRRAAGSDLVEPDQLATRIRRQPHYVRNTVIAAGLLTVAFLLASQLYPDLRIGTKVVTGAEAPLSTEVDPGLILKEEPQISPTMTGGPAFTDSFSQYDKGISDELMQYLIRSAQQRSR